MIVVIGTTTVDLFVHAPEQTPALSGDEFTTSNLAFCDEPLGVVLGGNGANCAYVVARLGAPVALCSAIGRDTLGDVVTSWLTDAGVNTAGLVRSETKATPTTTIIMDAALNRQSFHHAGASREYAPDDCPLDLLQRPSALLITSYPLLSKWRTDGVLRALSTAKAGGAITALDIGPAISRPADVQELTALLPHVDYLMANTHELAVCTGTADVSLGVDRLVDAGARTLIVKRGRDGALIRRSGNEAAQHVPGFPIASRSTVGAGDSFNAGLLVALVEGRPLPDAVRFANRVAARVVAAARGALGCPSRAEVFRERDAFPPPLGADGQQTYERE